MLEEYYAAREWDLETGYPSKRHLLDLDLDWVVKELERLGKIKE
jgi:aldehyde:ferredoxin oxidoreductase